MKSVIVLCVLSLAVVVLGESVAYPRGCVYVKGVCKKECEVGTRSYTPGCGYVKPEATCKVPNPVEDKRARICDYSACYCDPPTVRDTTTNKCVTLDKCPKK